jgi:hypothetical protein
MTPISGVWLLSSVFAFLLLAASSSHAASGTPGIIAGPITNPANACVYYLLAPNTWKGSQAEASILGGDLVSIHDAAENQWVFDTFSNYKGKHRALWIGLTDWAQTATFKWVDRAPVTYLNWADGEPNEIGRERFAYMYPKNWPGDPSDQPGGKWNNDEDRSEKPTCGVVKLRPVSSSISVLGMSWLVIWGSLLILGILSILLALFGGIVFLIFQNAKRRSRSS